MGIKHSFPHPKEETVIKEFPGHPAELRKGNSYPVSFLRAGPEDGN